VDDATEGWIHGSLVADSSAVAIETLSVANEVAPQETPAVNAASSAAGPSAVELSGGDEVETFGKDSAAPSSQPKKEKKVVYHRIGRDPFAPIDPDDLVQEGLLNVENSILVGVLFDNSERVALLEDQAQGGVAYALRENDPVTKGKVLRIQKDQVVFLITEMGISHSFTLKLKNKEE
jgi:hypothetical protein